MSTRAIIRFTDGNREILIDKGHDGHPSDVLPALDNCIRESEHRWSHPEIECMASLFIAMGFPYEKQRVPDYVIIDRYPEDTNFRYFLEWDRSQKIYKFGLDYRELIQVKLNSPHGFLSIQGTDFKIKNGEPGSVQKLNNGYNFVDFGTIGTHKVPIHWLEILENNGE